MNQNLLGGEQGIFVRSKDLTGINNAERNAGQPHPQEIFVIK